MLTLVAKLTVEDGKLEEVLQAFQVMSAKVRAEEPGCLTYRLHRSLEREHELLAYEQYVDEAAFEVHRSTPHFRALMASLQPLIQMIDRGLYESVIV